MERKYRMIGIDLLRLITMYMIVLYHILNHGGVRNGVAFGGGNLLLYGQWK